MKKQDLIFKIDGSIHLRKENSNIKYSDKEIFYLLKEEQYSIQKQIRRDISQELDEEVDIDIQFERGSIIVTGLVIIKWISITGGVFSFIDYTSRIVKRVLSVVLEDRIRRYGPNPVRPYIIISTTSNSTDFQEPILNRAEDKIQNPFSFKTILIAITLVNILLFLGGSIQGLFTVQSLKEQYIKSKEELMRINNELSSTSYEIKSNQERVKLDLESLPYKLEEKYSNPIKIKRDSLLIELNRLGGDLRILNNEIESQKEFAKTKIKNIPIKFENEFSVPLNETRDSLKHAITSVSKDITKLNEDLSKLNEFYNDSTVTLVKLLSDAKDKKNIRIGFKDLNWYIIVSIGFSLVNFLLIVVLLFIKKKK